MMKMFTKLSALIALFLLTLYAATQEAQAQCAPGQVQYTLTTVTGAFTNEPWWRILDSQGNPVIQTQCNSASNVGVWGTFPFCVNPCETYTFEAWDAFGDGWNGGSWTITGPNGQIIGTGNGSNNTGVLNPTITCNNVELEQVFTFSIINPTNAPTFTASGACNGTGPNFVINVNVGTGPAASYEILQGSTVLATVTPPFSGQLTGFPNNQPVTLVLREAGGGSCVATITNISADCSPVCFSYYYDSGGPNGAYGPNQNIVKTFCPDNPGEVITATFLTFNTEANWDRLYVYNGPDTNSPLISSGNPGGSGPCNTVPGGFWGNLNGNLPGPFTSTHPSGCLTFRFCTDASVQLDGFSAYITCGPALNCTPPVINVQTLGLNCANNTFSVQATVVSPSVPPTAPLIIANALLNGVSLPGVGGVMNNLAGNTLIITGIPLDELVVLRFNVFGFSCPAQKLVQQSSIFCPEVLTCGTPVTDSHCYGNNDQTFFYYQSQEGLPVQLEFNSGLIDALDNITIYNGPNPSFPVLFQGNNFGNLAGLQVLASSGDLYMTIQSNATLSCVNNSPNTSTWNWTVGCGLTIEGCTDPEALNFSPIATVSNGSCIFGGTNCENPNVVTSLPFTQTANTSLFGNNYLTTNVPPQAPGSFGIGTYSNQYLAGYEAVYEYTPANNTFIDIVLSNHGVNAGLWVFSGCPFASTLRWHLATDANGRNINSFPVEAGQTYYIVVSSRTPPQTIPFTLTITETVFDCPDLLANIGSQCDFNGVPGTVTEDCECGPFDFPGCTNGLQVGSITPACTGVPAVVNNARSGEFSLVTVYQGVTYNFLASPNANVPTWFITIATNTTPPVVLTTGQDNMFWTATFDGQVRFYTHSSYDCLTGVQGSASLHTRSASANCNNIAYDCPTFNAFIGDVCLQPGPGNTQVGGILNENCECVPTPFPGCLTGGTSPFGTQTPNCTTNANISVNNVWAGGWVNVNVVEGNTYTFGATNLPFFLTGIYITITNAPAGTNPPPTLIYAAGIGTLTWTSTITGVVRFYGHTGPDCTNPITGASTAHTRTISLSCVDCPLLGLNIGAACDDGNPNTINDTVQPDCTCAGELQVDCPVLGLNIGDLCNDNDPNTINDTVNAQCECVGTPDETECGIYTSTPNASFGASPPIVLDPLFVIGTGETIASIKVRLQIEHASLGDVEARIISPSGTVVELVLAQCGDGQNMDVLLQDGAPVQGCSPGSIPVLSGTFAPASPLNALAGEPFDGVWFLDVSDNFPAENDGVVVSWCIIPTFQVETIDCPALGLNIGDSCNDNNPATFNDTVNPNCQCVGTPYDCPDLLANIGDLCDDGDPTTTGDVVTASCGCAGVSIFDCPALQANIGDSCNDNNPATFNDTVNPNCQCVGTPYDCPNLLANIGDLCDDGDPTTTGDVVTASCGCAGVSIFDCPALQANIGDICNDNNPATFNDTVNADCQCVGTSYDCPELLANIGDPCDDGNPNTTGDVVTASCGCAGVSIFDCPALQANIGDICNDNNPATFNDTVNADCQCVGTPYDCSNLLANIGDPCDDGDPTTTGDVVTASCGCAGVSIFDCPALQANIGDICNDNNPATFNDTVNPNCQCVGTPYDCPDLLANIGDPCDDGNPNTTGDVVTAACGCAGVPVFDCVELQANIGDSCNDGNPATFNDTVNADCQCVGTPYDCVELLANIGDACNDGNPATFGDVITADCQCVGTTGTACDEAVFVGGMPTFAESEIPVSIVGVAPSGLPQCINPGNPQADRWFRFTSIATVMYVRGWGLGDYNAAVEVYDACGGNLLICQNDAPAGEREIVIIPNTVPGQDYFFRVYHGGAGTPTTQTYTAAVAHIPFTKLRQQDCNVFNYTPASIIASELPPNQFLLANWYFEFTELEAPFNTYEILSPNGPNPNFKLEWFPQAQYGRTYSVRTRPRMYQGPNWGDYGAACTIGFRAQPLTTQLIEAQANGFYNMCDILQADNVPGATAYRWRFDNGFQTYIRETNNRFLPLQSVVGLQLGSPYALRVRARTLGVWSPFGLWRLIAMNNFVVNTQVDGNLTPCGGTYPLNTVVSAVEICAAEFYTFRFTNLTDVSQPDLFYTRNDGLRTIILSWVTGLIPGHTYAVQVLGGSGGLVGNYSAVCNLTIAGGSGLAQQPSGTVLAGDDVATFEVYPNPTTGTEVMLAITNMKAEQQQIRVEIFDLYGKKVHSEVLGNNGINLNAPLRFHNKLAAGVYSVNVMINDIPSGSTKLVVQ